ncbi:long-chain fatty acid transport protein 4-like isoform X2 [Oratosquilla oratoria]|uniref:long-chain fatty acid transport protein 4-like isoform X2 n=1 Tax=Oratosquilla oratoria TaxID=337810 RepID=UPI003F7743A9
MYVDRILVFVCRVLNIFPLCRILKGRHCRKSGVVMLRVAFIAGLTAVLAYTLPRHLTTSLHLVVVALVLYLATGGASTVRIAYRTLPRDLRALVRYLKLLKKIRHAKKNNLSVPGIFQEVVRKHPSKVAFYFEDQKWTFAEVDEYSNKIANYFSKKGIENGDSVAVFMENRVEYVCTWLGLAKLGAVPALINSNLRLEPLTHCIKVASCKMVIFGKELQEAIVDIQDELEDIPKFATGEKGEEILVKGAIDLDTDIQDAPATTPSQMEQLNFADKLVYIYTSGTTGLPKPAIIKHSRCILAVFAGSSMIALNTEDTLYCPLPLYHLAASILGSGQALLEGLTVVLRKKFSASCYWSDCIKYGCTVGQYIGEICRYLLNTPAKPEDTQHKLRLMFGNGLRPQIWEQFANRFKIPKISEFYGSTEGNANIINIDGKPGAVGFVSVLFSNVYPCALIKVDESGEVVRDADGMCIRCKPGEPGEFVGLIVKNDPVRDFHGYADKRATAKKIAYDVLKKGDCAFLSGDVLVMDEDGYLYFKDRTGDTFRWRGENVSTSEVEGIVSKIAGNSDAVVYGVEVPGTEGRAGMAAIHDPEGTLDLEELAEGIQKSLPSYARPLFIRIVTKFDMTGTYKLKKVNLQKEGFDVSQVKDKLYFLDAKNGKYIDLSAELYEKISSGQARL